MFRAVVKRKVQGVLIASYGYALATGIFSTRLGRAAFEYAYSRYKVLVEAGEVDHLHAYVVDGGTVIDVGANIGFFSLKFASWVGASGRVFAIEPEAENFGRISARVKRGGYSSRVSLIQAAAAEKSGVVRLAINPNNPMDHRLSENGTPVRSITIDDLCASEGWPQVCLVKIDVQGAEGRVIAGALETLKRCSPALYIEIEESSVFGVGHGGLHMDDLTALGYRPYTLEKDGARAVEGSDAVVAIVKRNGYADFLFLKTKEGR